MNIIQKGFVRSVSSFSSARAFSGSVGTCVECDKCGKTLDMQQVWDAISQSTGLQKSLKNCAELNAEMSQFARYHSDHPKQDVVDRIDCLARVVLTDFIPRFLAVRSDVKIDFEYAQFYWEGLLPDKSEGISMIGDHGNIIVPFIKDAVERGILKIPGGVVDVGAGNSHTAQKIAQLNLEAIREVIVTDVNLVTALASPQIDNLSFHITDAEVFAKKDAKAILERMRETGNPPLILMNNFVNALNPEKGWRTIKFFFQAMQSGDQTIITGLPLGRLETMKNVTKMASNKGLIPFEKDGTFFRTAIDIEPFVEELQSLGNVVSVEDTVKLTEKYTGVRVVITKK